MNLGSRAWLTLENGTVIPIALDYCSLEQESEWINVTTLGSPVAEYVPAYSRLKVSLKGAVLGPLEIASMPQTKTKEEQEEQYNQFIREVIY